MIVFLIDEEEEGNLVSVEVVFEFLVNEELVNFCVGLFYGRMMNE